MATMQTLRENSKWFLWILLGVFILSMTVGGLVGGANVLDLFSKNSKLKGVVGIVNDNELKIEDYQKFIQYQLEQYRQAGQEIDGRTRDRIQEQVWAQFINETLIQQEIEKLGFEATNFEIVDYLTNYPPEFLKNQEVFQTEGEFDYQKYLNVLHNPQGDEWYPVEQQMRSSIPFEKIQYLVEQTVYLSESEILEQYKKTKVKYNLETITFPFSFVISDSFDVSESEISEYYENNKKDYFVDETRSLDYVFFEIKPSKQDSQSVLETITDLKTRVTSGESFETVAIEYTDDPSGKTSGGDLGWFGKGNMVPPFEKAAFNAKKGEVVGPILTSFGYHIIKVEDKRIKDGKDEVKARHILLNINSGPETLDKLRSDANFFAFDANDYGFNAAADSQGYKVEHIPSVRQSASFLPGLGRMPRAIKFAFSDKPVESVSELMSSEKGYAVFKLTGINEAHYKPIEDVYDIIYKKLETEKKVEKLGEIANNFYNGISKDEPLENQIDTKMKYIFDKHNDITLNKSLKSAGKSPLLEGSILALQDGDITKPIKINNKYVIVKLISKSEIQEEELAKESDNIRNTLIAQKTNGIYRNWIEALKDNADILDNRSILY